MLNANGGVWAQETTPPPETPAGPVPGEPYQDRLIDPGIEPLPPAEQLLVEDAGLPWLFGAEYRFGLRKFDGSETTEHGAQVTYQRDTANYGLLRLEMTGGHDDIDDGFFTGGDDGSHGHFTLTQTALPLGDGWFADNGLGVQRSASDPLIESSYRIYLPSSIINGATTRIGDEDEAWRFTWGETGRLEGLYTRTFEAEGTDLVGAGYSRSFNEHWKAAAEFWQADPEGEDTTRNLAGALEYADLETGRAHRIHLLTDDDGDAGVWYDGERLIGAWQHRFGAFSLADELEWQDNPILDNRDGVYYRGDYRTLTKTYTLGVDVIRTRDRNLLDYRLFGAASWRLSQDQRLGGQLSFGEREQAPGAFTQTDTLREYQFSAFYNHRVPWFDQRIEYRHQQTEGEFEQSIDRLRLDQFWNPGWLAGLATTLELQRREERDQSVIEARAGISYRYRFPNDLSLDAGLQWVRQDPSGEPASTSGNATLGLNWPINQHWSLGVNANYTESQTPVLLEPDNPMEIQGKQIFFNVSYSDFGGRPTRVLGAGSADAGIGRLTGYVYFDENRDGRRSPGERGAEGVVVRLDGIVTTITDGQGRYEFWPVAAGAHRLRVDETSVPLPWMPVAMLPVNVEPRGETYQDLPLQRIDE